MTGHPLRNGLWALALVLMCLPNAFGEDFPGQTKVESIGEATVTEVPAHVEFWLLFTFQEANLEQGMAKAVKVEANLRERMATQELRTSELEVAGPALSAINEKIISVAARARFPMNTYSAPETGPGQFAQLCDKMKALAEHFTCLISGPEFLPANKDRMAAAAVTAATENAFPVADAAANALKNAIYAVDTLRVEEIRWGHAPDAKIPEPNLSRVACTARVKVIYALGGQP